MGQMANLSQFEMHLLSTPVQHIPGIDQVVENGSTINFIAIRLRGTKQMFVEFNIFWTNPEGNPKNKKMKFPISGEVPKEYRRKK